MEVPAWHEAGHVAFACAVFGPDAVDRVSLNSTHSVRMDDENLLVMCLSGIAAVELFTDRYHLGGADLEHACTVARRLPDGAWLAAEDRAAEIVRRNRLFIEQLSSRLVQQGELYTGAIRALWRELGEPAPPPVSRTAASPASARSRFPIQVYDGDVCVGRVVVDGGRFRAETHYGTRLEDSAENAVRAVQQLVAAAGVRHRSLGHFI
jgi:hypothetical protein